MTKRIYFIARNELYSLYYSPIAWIMMVLFLILTGSDYLTALTGPVGDFERGGPSLMFVRDLTSGVMGGILGYYPRIIANLYLFFPLITMGLISREVSSGTIKLLYSSPVRIVETVLGKFLAMVFFTLSLLLIMLPTLFGMAHNLGHADYGHMVSGTVGLFLVLCAYAAIGLFISALTSYQIVAAIITLAVFGFLAKVGGLWQGVDWVRDITFYMNIGGKSSDLINGLFNLRDVTYFLILIMAFVSFTVIRLQGATESVSVLKKTTRYLTVILIAFTAGYVTNMPEANAYWDTTRDKIYTITPPTQAMLKKLDDGPLEVTLYGNLMGDFGRVMPSERNNITSGIWEPYIRFKPNIHLKFVYYYNTDTGSWRYKLNPGKTLKEIAEKEVKTFEMGLSSFLSPEEVDKQVNTEQEEFRNFFVLKYKDRSTILRTFDDIQYWPGENEIAAAINRLVGSPPKIAFVSDEIERNPFSQRPRDYLQIASLKGNRIALINQGYDFDTLSLKDKEIPQGLAGLVVADPRTPFSPGNLQKLQRYIAEGGNMLIATEPDRRDVVQPLLDTLGITLRKGVLLQPNDKFSSDCVFPYMSTFAKNLTPQFTAAAADQVKWFGDSLFRVAMVGADPLEYREKDGFHVEPMLTTDSVLSWNRVAPVNPDSLQLKVGRLPSDEHHRFVTSVMLQRNIHSKDQQIIVSSDADYLTKTAFDGWDPRRFNFDFAFWGFSRFSYGKFPANTLRPQTDDTVSIKVADLPFQRILFVYIFPAIVAVIGSIILIRRKRK